MTSEALEASKHAAVHMCNAVSSRDCSVRNGEDWGLLAAAASMARCSIARTSRNLCMCVMIDTIG